MKITVPSTKIIYIGDTEFYRKLKTTYPMKLGCSSCKRTIDELDMMCVWVNKQSYRIHVKCWDGKGEEIIN